MFAMIDFLRFGRTPRSFAASMAGLRQGLALLHLKGRNEVEDGVTRSFLVREECKAGEESLWPAVAARGQEAQPSPANQSH
jgi:hypothetical protein